MQTPASLFEVLRVLADGNVRFLIIGGVAMRLLGSSHVTDDVDVIYSCDDANFDALVEALAAYNPRLAGADPGLPFFFDRRTLKNTPNLTPVTDIGRIDLLGAASGADSFENLRARSFEVEVHDLKLRVVSLDDLISMKRVANRAKDQSHILELEAIRKLSLERDQK